MVLLASIASAVTVCVPETFQHWGCTQPALTLTDALAVPAVEEIHLRWDYADDQVTLHTLQHPVRIIGHAGMDDSLPLVAPIRVDNTVVRLQSLEIDGSVLTHDIEVVGAANVELDSLTFTTGSGDASRLRIDSASVVGTNLNFPGYVISNDDGPHVHVVGTGHFACTDCSFDGGQGRKGGSIHAKDAGCSVTVTDSTFTHGSSSSDGGAALYGANGAVLLAEGCTFDDLTGGQGGAVHARNDTTVTLRDSTFTNNRSDAGGAVHVRNNATLTIEDSLFCENQATDDGGAVWAPTADHLLAARSVFVENTAGDLGAAFWVDAAPLFLRHSTLVANVGVADSGVSASGSTQTESHHSLFLDHSSFALVNPSGLFYNQYFSDATFVHHNGFAVATEVDNVVADPLVAAPACSVEALQPPCLETALRDAGDGLPRGAVWGCTSPDLDMDGLSDQEEVSVGTQPNVHDTDGDGLDDVVECPPMQTGFLENADFAVPDHDAGFIEAVPGWQSVVDIAPVVLEEGPVPEQFMVVSQNEVFQAVAYDPSDGELMLRVDVINRRPVPGTLMVHLGPHSAPVEIPVHIEGQRGEYTLPIPAFDEPALHVGFSAAPAEVFSIARVYLGLPNDPDQDDVPNCLDDDSDGDHVLDLDEGTHFLNPLDPDTDGDGVNDHLDPDPLVSDRDQDGLPDWFEEAIGTSPDDADSDDDHFDDGVECRMVPGWENGGFETRHGGPPQASLKVPWAEVPGWSSSNRANAWMMVPNTTDAIPDGVAGDVYLEMRPHEIVTQTVDLEEHVRLSVLHRARFENHTLTVETGGPPIQLMADDEAWQTSTPVALPSGATTISLVAGSSRAYIDQVLLEPETNYGGHMGLLKCLDAQQLPDLDVDGDHVPASLDCDDNDPDVQGMFLHYADLDDDGFGAGQGSLACPGPLLSALDTDCADHDPHRNPGVVETCNGIDDNCDLQVDENFPTADYFRDLDHDGFGDVSHVITTCAPPQGYVLQDATDCDDHDASQNPDGTEVCNGEDDDCDGHVDNHLTFTDYYLDHDGDSYAGTTVMSFCTDTPPAGYATEPLDCDDGDPDIHPGQTEACDGIDQDCVGGPDDGLAVFDWFVDLDEDGYGAGPLLSGCDPPETQFATGSGDCDDHNPNANPAEHEICNGVDDDCNDHIDDGLSGVTYFVDEDGDGFGTGDPVGTCQPAIPHGFVDNDGDCDDHDEQVHPDVHEICDGIDNNCSGHVDDGLAFYTYYLDHDGDGAFGTPIVVCDEEPPAHTSTSSTDCDDDDPTRFPDADEDCDAVDRDCDGDPTDGAIDPSTWYLDADSDSFGSMLVSAQACVAPTFYVADHRDCNDANAGVNPDALEICDGFDNDCNLLVDDHDPMVHGQTLFYQDLDNDGYGVEDFPFLACVLDHGQIPTGYADQLEDCDDADASAYPGASELCDGIDNDCDEEVDGDDIDYVLWYLDDDGDTFGDEAVVWPDVDCASPHPDYVASSTDCNDDNAAVFPGAHEDCDGIDSNCANGENDAVDVVVLYVDLDMDGFGDTTTQFFGCHGDGVVQASDCDDHNEEVYPGRHEMCDGLDNDCNQMVDDNPEDAVSWFVDLDGDFYSNGDRVSVCGSQSTGAIQHPLGEDCDDNNPLIHENAPEICDSIDNDCDELIDANDPDVPTRTYYADFDEDGFGDPHDAEILPECQPPSHRVENQGDCNDADRMVNPGGQDVCDGDLPVDRNCDGVADVDEGFLDVDGDGWGGTTVAACGIPDSSDCDDADAEVHPEAVEVDCNGIDDDCTGVDVCPEVAIEDSGCRCDASGVPSVLWLGMFAALTGLRRRG